MTSVFSCRSSTKIKPMAKSAATSSKHSKPAKPPLLKNTLNFSQGSYLDATSQPLYAMFFLLPLIIAYELGTLMVNTHHIANTLTEKRVVAFVWLEDLAGFIGFGPSMAWAFPGFLVLLILFCWHVTSKRSWKIKANWLGWMALESFLLTLPLFAFSALMNCTGLYAENASLQNSSYAANLITSIGAGIYEEMVFRLIFMGLTLMIIEDFMEISSTWSTIVAVVLSATLFSAHHYVSFINHSVQQLEPFSLFSFLFRMLAGVYFAILFRYRGYGITAGTHTAYNMILFAIQ